MKRKQKKFLNRKQEIDNKIFCVYNETVCILGLKCNF